MTCLFCEIAKKNIPANLLYEDESIIAFRDIKPQAPQHILIVPKEHIATIDDANENHAKLIGDMILKAQCLAKEQGLSEGYRLVFNVNSQGGQEIYHIHLHLLGGRQMMWPPG